MMDEARKPNTANPETPQTEGATASPASGLECPTCGDRFPSQDALQEHLPSHKLA